MSRRSISVQKKRGLLTAYAIQNASLVLLMRYSRSMAPVNGFRYHTSTVVFLSEVTKLVVSLTMALFEVITNPRTPHASTVVGIFSELGRAVFADGCWRLGIPALLYNVQNTLSFTAVENMEVPTYQAASQLKIAMFAILGAMFLGRKLDMRRWLSLVFLTIGVVAVIIPLMAGKHHILTIHDLRGGKAHHSPRSIWDLRALGSEAARKLTKRSATYAGIDEDYATQHPEAVAEVGLMALLFTCMLSALAGVYIERTAERTKSIKIESSMWVRNVQLSLFSLLPAFLTILVKDGESVTETSLFAGYNWVVLSLVAVQAAGGIIVAAVMSHTDYPSRNTATGASVILSFATGVSLFGFEITSFYLLGTLMILGAMYAYSTGQKSSTSKTKPPPISVSQYEKSEVSYFDLETGPTPAQSPMQSGATSTSRPATPALEQRPLYMKSSSNLRSKQDL